MFEGKLLTYILLAVIAVLGWSLVDEKYINPAQVRTDTDTVYVDKPFKVETVTRGDEIIPAEVTLWKTEYVDIGKIELVDDTVKIMVEDTTADPIYYDTRFLTNYTYAPKLLELTLEEDKIAFTGMRPNGETETNEWPANFVKNDYRLAPDGNGWVGLEADRASGLFGLDFGFSHSLELGNRWMFKSTEFNSTPYIQWEPSLQIKQNISIEGAAGLSSELYGSVGLEYTF